MVAAQLAAYLTTLRARADLAAVARHRDEAWRAAEAANRAKDEFLALVSHELRTPLSSILAWVHTLRSTTDPQGARAIEEIHGNVQAQAKIIDDILDLACIESAKLRLNLRTIEPARLIKTILAGLRFEAERRSIRLESDLDAATMPLVLDPDRIGEVISILVASAINFTPAGGRVDVRLERTSGYARIQVTDGGSGIAPPEVPRASVGLPIVKDLVELHGGRVSEQSAGPERGTTVTVELPRVREARAAPGVLPRGEHAEDRRLAGIRVLLVDHDLGLRESFHAVLDSYGAEVTAVASAPEALAALERSRPDVLLFGDLATRGENVYDLMRDVTARASPLPVASISAWRLEKERELAAGFRLHLAKPLEMGTLVDAVSRLAGRIPGRAPRP
jgi:CheY-like chemotaxis protein